jgi:multiple antibiotic resistance protein
VLLVFTLVGKYILALLGIEAGSFFIAGGIMLFIISLEMLFGKANQSKVSSREREGDGEGHTVAVFPLAIPMLAGPGAITAIILYTGGAEAEGGRLAMTVTLIVSLVIIMAMVWVVLRGADVILRILGKMGISVFERIMGLLLAGLSVQFVYDGVARLGLVPGGL